MFYPRGGMHIGGDYFTNLLRLSFEAPYEESSFLGIWPSWWNYLVEKTWLLGIDLAYGVVLLFFLISGFVIAISVERQSWLEFGIKCFLRLMPVLWVTILAWLCLNYLLRLGEFSDQQPFDLKTLLANALLVSDWLWTGYYDLGLWTLHVEIKFYFLMAGLIIVAGRLNLGSILGLAAFVSILSLLVVQIGNIDGFAELYKIAGLVNGSSWPFFFNIIGPNAGYIMYMLMGSLIYLWHQDRISIGQSLCSCGALFAIFTTFHTIAPNGIAQIYFIEDGARALIIFNVAVWIEKIFPQVAYPLKFLSHPLNFLGNISYPLYLVHGLFDMSIISVLHVWTGSINIAICLATIIVFPWSWLLHKYVEIPAQKLGKRISTSIRQKI